MTEEYVQIKEIELKESIKGFHDIADIKQPETGDIYLSSKTGHLETWRHACKGKSFKIVLRPLVTVNLFELPPNMLLATGSGAFTRVAGMVYLATTLYGGWQANQWLNCPFKKDTVRLKIKTFGGGVSGLMRESMVMEARSVIDWENVAQFKVVGLMPGVKYSNQQESAHRFC